jgi:hypothetical protein
MPSFQNLDRIRGTIMFRNHWAHIHFKRCLPFSGGCPLRLEGSAGRLPCSKNVVASSLVFTMEQTGGLVADLNLS